MYFIGFRSWSKKFCMLTLLFLLSIIASIKHINGFPIHNNKKKYLPLVAPCINTADNVGINYSGVEPANEIYTYLNVFDDISGYCDDEFPSDFGSEEGIYGEVLPSSLRSLFEPSVG